MKRELEQTLLRAFVLMPFDSEFDMIFNELVKPALEEVGYDVKRADSIANQQNILKDVVRGIAEADLVVADLTSVNPNVFYELGISHAMQKDTVLLTQSIEDVPFDLKSYRVIKYSVHFHEALKLPQELKEIAEKAKRGKLRFGNPVTDFLPTAPLLTKAKKAVIEAEGKKEAKPEEEEERGLWDFVVDGVKSIKDITECTKRMTKATKEISNKVGQRTVEVQKIAQNGVPGTTSRIYKLTTTIAMDMTQYAKKLEEEQPKFHSAWESFDENITGLLQTTRIQNEKDKEVSLEFRSQVDNLLSSVKNALKGERTCRESIANLKGISRDVNQASKRTAYVLDLLISDLEGADSYCIKVLTLLDEKIEREVWEQTHINF